MIDFSQARLTPYDHQVVGSEALFRWDNPDEGRIAGGCFALFDEMGAGKTKQVIDAACALFWAGKIDRVLIICPNAVRSVWFDPVLGELQKHLWLNTPVIVKQFHGKIRSWTSGPEATKKLEFVITNYEFIRSKNRLIQLKPFATKRTWLVLDESSAIKSYKSLQTKACFELRKQCVRVVLLNGTPIANNPGDLYSQMRMMSEKILECKTWYHYRARYGVLGGFMGKQIVSWTNLEDLQRRIGPYVLRRLKTDCLDLPKKLPPVTVTVPLTEATWSIYKEMRDEMVAWLNESQVSIAGQAIVKAMRLAQLTSGFLGGMQDPGLEMEIDDTRPDYLPFAQAYKLVEGAEAKTLPPQEVGREKLDMFLEWLEEQLDADPNFKILVWCRFRPELERVVNEVRKKFPDMAVGKIHGGQKKEDRDYALQLLDPRTAPEGPVGVFGTPSSGSMGLNLTAAHNVFYMSNDYSLKTRLQSEDRVHRPGQTENVNYFDMVATGPDGQKTIDHGVIKALRNKESLANFVTEAWLSMLQDS